MSKQQSADWWGTDEWVHLLCCGSAGDAYRKQGSGLGTPRPLTQGFDHAGAV